MTENTDVETTTVPSKFEFLKSPAFRQGLILGGVIAGATIAGVMTLLKNQTPDVEYVDIDENITIDTVNITPAPES